MNSAHQALVVRIAEIEKHPNADTLGIVRVGGYQAVVKLGDFQPGDLAVYIQPDSVVPATEPFKFIWAFDGMGNPRDIESTLAPPDESGVPFYDIPPKWRRVTVRKFRKEWSEGLLIPLSDFPRIIFSGLDPNTLEPLMPELPKIGDDIAELLRITHYDPDEGKELDVDNERSPGKQDKRWPHSLKGWLHFLLYHLTFGMFARPDTGFGNEAPPKQTPPIYDVEAYKNYPDVFQKGELVTITEKIHGSNARYVFYDGHMYAGSRRLWKKAGTRNIWRRALETNPWIETWCRANPGFVLYGEVVPTQKKFDYGATPDFPKFFVFDIRTPEGEWALLWTWATPYTGISPNMNDMHLIEWVPILTHDSFNEEVVYSLVDGPSEVRGAEHAREGIVILAVENRVVHNLNRPQLKIISNAFLAETSKE